MINYFNKLIGFNNEELSFADKDLLSKQKYLWILDPGHGALTKGKRSPVTDDNRQLYEYEYNFDIAKMIEFYLKEIDIRSIVTINDPSTVGNALLKRVLKANFYQTPLQKIFVSIHGNAGPSEDFSTSFKGIETFYYSPVGKRIADVFQKELVGKTKLVNRGIKKGNFYVLRYTDHPAILTENGFYNNPQEFELMMTKEFRKKIAQAHVAAIQKIENTSL